MKALKSAVQSVAGRAAVMVVHSVALLVVLTVAAMVLMSAVQLAGWWDKRQAVEKAAAKVEETDDGMAAKMAGGMEAVMVERWVASWVALKERKMAAVKGGLKVVL